MQPSIVLRYRLRGRRGSRRIDRLRQAYGRKRRRPVTYHGRKGRFPYRPVLRVSVHSIGGAGGSRGNCLTQPVDERTLRHR